MSEFELRSIFLLGWTEQKNVYLSFHLLLFLTQVQDPPGASYLFSILVACVCFLPDRVLTLYLFGFAFEFTYEFETV